MTGEVRRWCELWARLGAVGEPQPVVDLLIRAYSEPHRAYHTLDHIRSCLTEFDAGRHLAGRPDEVELAIWFHDVVYDTYSTDNEARSADYAEQVLRESGLGRTALTRIHDLILATRHANEPAGVDGRLLVDVDLSIFGRAAAEFDRYERQIRQEYHRVGHARYCRARAEILESFLGRQAIFYTEFFRARYERQARLNLARSIARLRSQASALN